MDTLCFNLVNPKRTYTKRTMIPKEQMRVLLAISVGLGAGIGSLSWSIINHGPALLLVAAVAALVVFFLLGARVIQKAPKTVAERATC